MRLLDPRLLRGGAVAVVGLFASPSLAADPSLLAFVSAPAAPPDAPSPGSAPAPDRLLVAQAGPAAAGATDAPAPGADSAARAIPEPRPAGGGVAPLAVPGAGREGVKVGGLLQTDGRAYQDRAPALHTDAFLVRRAQLNLEGSFTDLDQFKFQVNVAGGEVNLQDVYLDLKLVPATRLRVGKQRPAWNLVQSNKSQVLAENGFPNGLTPTRDIGVDAVADVGWLLAAAGVFNGTADGTSSDTDGSGNKDFYGRVFVKPFASTELRWLKGLGVGAGATLGRSKGDLKTPEVGSYKSFGQLNVFKYAAGTTLADTVVQDGERRRASLHASYYGGPVGVQAEYARSSARLTKGADTIHADHSAWQATVNVVVTGEDASFEGVVPRRPFDLKAGRFGAFEVGVRYTGLDLDREVFDRGFARADSSIRSARSVQAGAAWTLNRNLRLYADYGVTGFDRGAAASAGGDRTTERVFLSRVQASF